MQRMRWLVGVRAVSLLALALLFLAIPSSTLEPLPSSAAPRPEIAGAQVWWLLLAAPLIAHGLAHLSGLFAPFTQRDLGFTERPWLLASRVTPHSAIGRAFGLLWLAAAAALVAAGLGLLLGQGWWAALAIVAATLSLADILIWWRAVPPGARVGAAFDVVILLAALQATPLLRLSGGS